MTSARTRKPIWSQNHAPKNPKVKSEKFSSVASYFGDIFVHLKKNTSQARIKPEIFVNFRPESEPDPKSPARLTTLLHRLKFSKASNITTTPSILVMQYRQKIS